MLPPVLRLIMVDTMTGQRSGTIILSLAISRINAKFSLSVSAITEADQYFLYPGMALCEK